MKGIRFFSALIIILAVAVLVANGLWLLPALDTINRGVSDLHLEIARRARTAIEVSLEEVKDSVRESVNLIGQNPRLTGEIITRLLNNNPSLREVAFVGLDGLEKFKISRTKFISDKELGSRKGEAVFQEIISGHRDEYESPIFFSLLAEPLREISTVVRSPDGEVVGVIIVENNLRFIWDLISQISVGPGGRVYVVDQSKNLIADPNPSIVLRGVNLAYRSIVNKVIGGEVVDGLSSDDSYTNFDGETVFAVGLPVENLGWGIIVEQNFNEAFSSRRRITVFAALFAVLASILLGALLWVMRRLINLFSALDLEKKQTQAIISNLTDGLIEYSEDFKVIFINPTAEKIFGVRAREVVGRKFEPKDSAEIKFSSFAFALFPILADEARSIQADSEHLKIIELKIHHPLDRDLQIVTAPIINESGRIFSYLKVIRDVTREKVITRTKSEFISLAAHQLRTPLSAIKWTLSMILDGDAGPITPELKSLLTTGFLSNDRMITLVNDLLDVARIEEGRFEFFFQEDDLVSLVDALAASFKDIAAKKGINLSFNKPEKPLSTLVFDRIKMRMALQNIIENAVAYTPSGGKVEIGVEEKDDALTVGIRDSGMGIAAEDKRLLFTKFNRSESAIKIKPDGSGLGLFISRNIVLGHGGSVEVESEVGRGSTFRIILPKKRKPGKKRLEPAEFEEFMMGF
ncbi:MAG: ATP-binding protein [Patescibacteria group bacterium]